MGESNERAKKIIYKQEVFPDICVCCGEYVPEGRMICWKCEHQYEQDKVEIKKGNDNQNSSTPKHSRIRFFIKSRKNK